jgi:hypothetical protein
MLQEICEVFFHPRELLKSLPPLQPPLSKIMLHDEVFFHQLNMKLRGCASEPTVNFKVQI